MIIRKAFYIIIEMTRKVHFKSTRFGQVVVNRRRYNCDIFVWSDGKIRKRHPTRRRGMFGSHNFSIEEIEPFIEKDVPEILVVGTGQFGVYITMHTPPGSKDYPQKQHYGSAHLTSNARELCGRKGVKVVEMKTPRAIEFFNTLEGKKAALIHVAC
jgi:hypothetical protein